MTLQEIRKFVGRRLETTPLSPKLFLSRFKIGVDSLPVLFTDPTYLPLYYYLGRLLPQTKNLLEIGFDLGMPSGCFMSGCPGIEFFLAFRKAVSEGYHTKRLGVSNIHNIWKKRFDLWVGNETDPEFVKSVLGRKWDCVLVGDARAEEKTIKAYLNLVWNQMADGGLVIVDYLVSEPVREAYNSFCKSNNREPFVLKTFRSTGMLQK
jgi:hypothetical protein